MEVQKFINETPPAAMMSTIKAAVALVAVKAPEQAADIGVAHASRDQLAEASKEGGFLAWARRWSATRRQPPWPICARPWACNRQRQTRSSVVLITTLRNPGPALG